MADVNHSKFMAKVLAPELSFFANRAEDESEDGSSYYFDIGFIAKGETVYMSIDILVSTKADGPPIVIIGPSANAGDNPKTRPLGTNMDDVNLAIEMLTDHHNEWSRTPQPERPRFEVITGGKAITHASKQPA